MTSKSALFFLILNTAVGQSQDKQVVTDRLTAARERKSVLAAVASGPGTREAALKALVQTAHHAAATDAVVTLIRLHASGAEELAVELFPSLPDQDKGTVLGTAGQTFNLRMRDQLARAVLQDAADSARRLPDNNGTTIAGYAARLLVEDTQSADSVLIGRALLAYPHDYDLWLAVAKMGNATADQLSLARSVMLDTAARPQVRASAAAVLAPLDSTADDFVMKSITSFLSAFAQRDFLAMSMEWRSQADQKDPKLLAEEGTFYSEFRVLAVLQCLHTRSAEKTTFEYIDAENIFVRNEMGLIAVQRWPDRFLALAPSHREERPKLLAAMSLLHPNLLSRIQAQASPAELDAMRAKIKYGGVVGQFAVGGGALVF